MTNTPIEMTVSRPRAVVTGAAQGIGAAICERLRSDGFEVTGLDLHPGEAGDPARSCDITDKMAVEALAAELGPVGVLVNNAGIWRFAPLLEAKSEDVRAVLEVNLIGTLNCIQAFGRRMIGAGGGSIVNIISIAANQASPGVGIYPASKAAVIGLTRQVALEWGPLGVRANAVGPGLIPTEGTGDVYDDAEVRKVRSGAVPLRRLGTPRDVANVVAFFASPDSSYVNGQVIYVDGGLTQGLMGLLPRPAATGGPQIEAGALDVVRRHLAFVSARNEKGMSADYTLDAVLRRPDSTYVGRNAIAEYFRTVGPRLGDGTVELSEPTLTADGSVVVRWRINGGPGHGAAGHDTYVVADGFVSAQTVSLETPDF